MRPEKHLPTFAITVDCMNHVPAWMTSLHLIPSLASSVEVGWYTDAGATTNKNCPVSQININKYQLSINICICRYFTVSSGVVWNSVPLALRVIIITWSHHRTTYACYCCRRSKRNVVCQSVGWSVCLSRSWALYPLLMHTCTRVSR